MEYVILIFLVIFLVIIFALFRLKNKMYPEETLENIVNCVDLRNMIAKNGDPGDAGLDGIVHSVAPFPLKGPNAPPADPGKYGNKGGKGAGGGIGFSGFTGPYGPSGKLGQNGVPSNSIIPYVNKYHDTLVEKMPVIFDHEFSYRGNVHKLTASFLFDDICYFSLGTSEPGHRVQFNTDSSQFRSVPLEQIPSINFIKKVYGNIRVLLEEKTDNTDGIVFYLSPPINRDGYLLITGTNLNYEFETASNLDEISITQNLEFTLDNQTKFVQVDSDIYYNYMIGGLLRYRAIFNIDPPIDNVFPRLEETFSSDRIEDLDIHSIKLTNKGNMTKISDVSKTTGEGNINLVSPRLKTGNVVYRDSSNVNNLWTVQSYTTINESLDFDYPPLIQAFDEIEKDGNTMKTELYKVKIIKVFDSYDTNFNVLSKGLLLTDLLNFTAGESNDVAYMDGVMTFNNFSIGISNINYPLGYPLDINGKKLFIAFLVNIKFEDTFSHVLRNDIINRSINLDALQDKIHIKFIDSVIKKFSIMYKSENNINKFPIIISYRHNIDFNKCYGEKIILRFFDSSATFKYTITSDTVETDNSLKFENVFDKSIQYGIIPNSNWGLYFNCKKFSIANNNVIIGYTDGLQKFYTQNVYAAPQVNGDYILDVPPTGYQQTIDNDFI